LTNFFCSMKISFGTSYTTSLPNTGTVRCYSIIVSFIVRPRESTTYLVRLLGIERARFATKYEVVTPGAERHRNATAEKNECEDIAILQARSDFVS
jgi:hypothetical protein